MAKKYDIKAYACIVALAYISNKNPLQFAPFGDSAKWQIRKLDSFVVLRM